MYIKKITWLDKEAEEAAVLITDGTHECLAFCHPCRLKEGTLVKSALISLNERSVVAANKNAIPGIVKQSDDNDWSHSIVAIIEDKSSRIVAIGGIKLELSQLPGDLNQGDIIECYPSRLDLLG